VRSATCETTARTTAGGWHTSRTAAPSVKPASHPSAPPAGCPRLVAAVAALGLALSFGGCKTRLLSLDEEPGVTTRDGAPVPDFPDLADLLLPRDNCGVESIQTTEVIRADLLLVQDRSSSMRQGVDGSSNPPAGQSKWELVRAAIEQVSAKTTSVDWGLMLFGSTTTCRAPTQPEVPVGPGNAAKIRQVLDSTTLTTGTPTTAALKNALAWYQTVKDGHPRFLLLATDGQPNCGSGGTGSDDSAAAIQAVAAAANAGIMTFVAGIGSNTGAEQTLDAMAIAGKVPNTTAGQRAFYPVTSTQDLVNVLEKAAIRITTCSYPLKGTPPDPNLVTIRGTGGVIPRDPAHQDGWDYSDDGKNVVFFGEACSRLQEGVVTSVEAVFACPDM